MKNQQASHTAQFAAYNRALGNLSPVVPGFSDPIAEQFLPKQWKKRIEKARKRLPASPYPFWSRGMGVCHQFRTAVLDNAIESALPFSQLVILGAGFDSRAWRLPGLEHTTVFEMDHPATQALKKREAQNRKTNAGQIRFTAMDFTTDHLPTRLDETGFKRNEKTFWLWEAVAMYLTPGEIAATLASIAGLSTPESVIAFTYMGKRNGKVPQSIFLSLLGEPVRSGFDHSEISELVHETGWTLVEDTGIENWEHSLTPNLRLTRRDVGIQWNERVAVAAKR